MGRLAESSAAQKAFDEKNTKVEEGPESEELRLHSQAVESANHNSGDVLVGQLDEADSNLDCIGDGVQKSRTCTNNSCKEWTTSMRIVQDSVCKGEDAKMSASANEETIALEVAEDTDKHHQELSSLHVNSSEDKLLMELEAKASEVQHLEAEYELLNKAFKMVSDGEHPIDFYIEELSKLAEARRHNLVKHESHWNTLKMPLEEKKRSLEEASWLKTPNAHEKLQKKKAIEQEIKDISAEVKRRDEEISALSAELDNRTKVAPRWSFVQRVKEITKNSRKQDIDIEKILKDTRDLQLESNSIQERLNRTYAVVSETIFRGARKDAVGRQAYRILTRIHETFEQTAEAILASDRIRREVAYYEAKVANMASQSLNIDKVQADLVAIKKENDILEQQLEKNSSI